MVDSYNSNLSNTLDKHAALVEKDIIILPNTAWYNSHNWHANVIKQRLERKYKKSRLQSDKDIDMNNVK